MSNPITWKNVNAPNFNASNVLALGATKQMNSAFDSLSQRFMDQGEYNKERNTGDQLAQVANMNDLDNFSTQKAQLLGALPGNVDKASIVDSLNLKQGFLQKDATFNFENAAREREEADRVAVAGAFDAFNQDWTKDSPSMTQDDIRDTPAFMALSGAQKAEALPQLASMYGQTSEEAAMATSDAAVKKMLLQSSLNQQDEDAKQASKAKYDGSYTSPKAKGIISIMDKDANVDKSDSGYQKHLSRVRKWDSDGGKLLINGEWVTVPNDIMAAATQQAVERGNNKFWNWVPGLTDDTDFYETPFDEDVLQLLRDKRSASNDFGDPK